MKNVNGKSVSKKELMAAKTITMLASLSGLSENEVRRLQSELQNNGELTCINLSRRVIKELEMYQ